MLTVQNAKRYEIWSNLQCAGGVRQGFLLNVISCVASVKTNGDDKLTFSLPLAAAGAALLVEDAIVRLWQDDATFDEWIVVSAARDTAAGTLSVECDPVATLLGRRGLFIGQTDADGVTRYDIEAAGLTPTQIIDTYVIPTLSAAGLTWIARGTVDPTTPIDITLSWDPPLALLQRVRDLARCELQLRRNGTIGYFIDLVTRIGAGAAVGDVRVRKNLLSLQQKRTVADYTTRIFPRGAARDTEYATMGRAVWNVATLAGGVVGLADPVGGAGPLLYDGQLVGAKIRKADGTLTAAITASSAGAQTVTVPSAAGIALGDLVQFRKSDGTELTYLETVDAGKSVGRLDNPDIPSTNNVIPNPACRAWPGALPTGWAAVGGPATAKQIVGPFTRIGGASIHVTAGGAGQGVISPSGKVFPTALAPYGAGFAMLWVVSGQVKVELVVTKADTTQVVLPTAPNVASSTTLGQWENLGVSGEDLNKLTAVSVAVRITSIGVAEFYVDAVQVTQSPSQLDFVEGSGGTRLWQAANERLRTNGGPSFVYTVPFIDLARLDGTTYATELLTLGGNVRVTDDRIPVAITTRIVELQRNYALPGDSKVTLSTLADDLTGTSARPTRPPRLDPVTTGTGTTDDPGTSSPIAAPAIALSYEVEDANGIPQPVILVSFTPPAVAGFVGLLIAVRGVGNTYATQAPVTDSPIRIEALYGVTYDVEAWAVNKAGVKSTAPSTQSITIPANHRIGRQIPFLHPTTHADDGFGLYSTTNDGFSSHSSVKESGGKSVNRLFAKGLLSDPDNADSVLGGSIRRVPLTGASDSSGNIDLGGSAWINRHSGNVARSAGDGTAIQTIVGNVTNSGHAGSGMQESGGKALNRLLAKSLAADSDSLDGVPEGTSFKRVIASRVSSGKPIIDYTDNFHIRPDSIQTRQCPVSIALVVTNALTNGGAIGQYAAGVSFDYGVIEFDVLSVGGIVDVLLDGGAGPNGYFLRFDGRSGQRAGQILKVTAGTWTNIGTAQGSNNPSALLGWHNVKARVMRDATGTIQFDIFVDGHWLYTAQDSSYSLSGSVFYGYEVTANPQIAPAKFLQNQRRLPLVATGGTRSTQTSNPLTVSKDAGGNTTFTIAAHTVQYGFGTVSYNSGSVGPIAGLFTGTVVHIYADDPTFAGGAVTYFQTTFTNDLAAADGRYYVGAVTVPAPSGSGGQSGGGGGSFQLH